MIFKPEMVEKILAGEKTVTRRPARAYGRYAAGRDYALQPGRGKFSVGRILIEAADLTALGSIDDADARREGFPDRAAFLVYWRGLYGTLDDGQTVARFAFRLLARDAPEEGT